METTRRFLAPALGLALLLAGCTGDASGDDPGPTTPATLSPSESQEPLVPSGTGEYRYANLDLVATLDLDDGTGTLEIENGTGRELPAPGFYILDARDGRHVEGTVVSPAPIPDGETTSFDVAFEGIEIRNIGLVVLMLGPDNYGAFVPQ